MSQPNIKQVEMLDINRPFNWDKYTDASRAAFNFMKKEKIDITVDNFDYWTNIVLYYAHSNKIMNIVLTFDETKFREYFTSLPEKNKKLFRKLDPLELCKNYIKVLQRV